MRHPGGSGSGPENAGYFWGLTTYPPVPGEPGGRAYADLRPGDYRDTPRTQVAPATHPCRHDYVFFPFTTYFTEDPSVGSVAVNYTLNDLMQAIYPQFAAPEDQETLAEIVVPPDYVQVGVAFTVETIGGNNACPAPPTSNLFFSFPLDPVDGGVTFQVDPDFGGEFPWGLFEDSDSGSPQIDQNTVLPGGHSFDYGPQGFLRRPVDADTYVETSDFPFEPNDAVDTLFPWDEFIAAPSISFVADGEDVNSIRIVSAGGVVRPYWVIPDDSIPTSLVLEAGPGGWRRRPRIFGSQTSGITVG